jgi:putative toxin-antitoxin system antitoxin component (TIGR02293 family)
MKKHESKSERENKNNSTTQKKVPVPYPVKEEEDNLKSISVEDYYVTYMRRSVDLMGMANEKTFMHVANDKDLIPVIRAGVPKKALDTLVTKTGINKNELPNILSTSERTLRRYSEKQKLNPEQSERIIELAKLYSRGEDVFGNLDAFKEWMEGSVMALGNKKPIEFLDTSLGIQLLMDELGRIEHGIFA